MINTKVYDNGLKLVVEEMPNFESCAVYVMVKTGSANEKEGFMVYLILLNTCFLKAQKHEQVLI